MLDPHIAFQAKIIKINITLKVLEQQTIWKKYKILINFVKSVNLAPRPPQEEVYA